MHCYINHNEIKAAFAISKKVSQLPSTAIHHASNSNNWAVDGIKTTTGKPLMAVDPHLNLTLPAIWYQISAKDTNYNFQGVIIPVIWSFC